MNDEQIESIPAWRTWTILVEVLGVAVVWIACILIVAYASGCKSGNAAWNIQNGQMSTQFQIDWGTSVKIGFPGMLHGDAKGAGELKGEPVPVAPSEPHP